MDTTAVEQPLRAEWASGAAVGSRTLVISELLCESVDLHAGERVLDVACGSGNAALAAARRFCRVLGVDHSPALLERARRRAEAEGLEVTFVEGAADDLPFPDGRFDVVLSACGAMSTPDRERTAGELLRVCRPGGRIGLVCWTPDSYVVEFFAAFHGPTVAALQALGPDGAGALQAEMLELAGRFDVSEDDTLVLRLDYLEVVVHKPAWR